METIIGYIRNYRVEELSKDPYMSYFTVSDDDDLGSVMWDTDLSDEVETLLIKMFNISPNEMKDLFPTVFSFKINEPLYPNELGYVRHKLDDAEFKINIYKDAIDAHYFDADSPSATNEKILWLLEKWRAGYVVFINRFD